MPGNVAVKFRQVKTKAFGLAFSDVQIFRRQYICLMHPHLLPDGRGKRNGFRRHIQVFRRIFRQPPAPQITCVK